MLTLVSTLLLSVITLLAVYLYNNYTYWKRRGVCYETPLPFIGNFKGIGRTHHFKDINQRLYNRFKGQAPFCGFYLFLNKAVLTLDLDLIKHILIKDFSSFHDRGIFNNVKDDPLTGHLVALEGEQWRAMRTKLTPVFTSARMKYMFPTVVKVGESFAAAMRKEAEDGAADHVVEIKDLCARFTTDVIGTSAFGIDCNSLQDPNAEFRKKGRSIFGDPRHGPLVQTFMITNPKLARKFNMKLFKDNITDFFLNIVRQTVNYRLENNIKRNDFMDLIIELKAKNEDMVRESQGIDLSQGLMVEQMAAQTFVFFLAGFETSSTTMSFCLYELARNPDVQEKLRKEILQTIKENGGELTYENMNAMKYLEQVIAETLRLYPIISNLIRKAMTDYQVPSSTHVIEKGTTIIIPVAAIHYDADYYPNPCKFDPSRFEPQQIEKRHTCCYLPFGDGPRNCIGSRFGKMQTKIGLISLLQRYRFECSSQTEIPLEIDKKNFLISPKNGINLKVIMLERNESLILLTKAYRECVPLVSMIDVLCCGNFDMEDKDRPGQPKKLEDQELEASLLDDCYQTQQDLAVVSRRLRAAGFIQKLRNWRKMFLVFGTLIFCLLNILAFYLYNCYSYWKRRGVLYETPLPIFGNFLGVGKTKHMINVIGHLYRKFNGKAPFCGAYLFVSKVAVIFDLDLIKNILIKDFSNFHDRNAYHNVEDDPLTGHLVLLEGEEWRAMRTKLTPVFTSAKMKYMFPTMVAVGKNFSQTLKQELSKTPNNVLEIKDLCARFTTDVIGSCAFGIECNSLQDPNAEFRVKGRAIFTDTRHGILVQMFMMIFPDLARKLHMKLFTDSVSDFFINIVKQTVDYRLANNIKRNDFMDLLIELKNKNDDTEHNSSGIDLSQGLTIEQMAAQTFVFFLGGFETSSITISFCLYELAKHMKIQEKLRHEILAEIKECNNEITYEVVNNMVYLKQVIAETLRMYPVLPNLVRRTKNDYQVPNTEHIIEKGIDVVIPVSAIHYDVQYYEEPTKFDPDRFLASEIEKRHSSAYLPFGDGPRSCIGSRFGKMQTKLGLISILSQYRVECCSQTEIPIEFDKTNILVSSKNGIYLRVVPL
ncbi:uncharacterized protein LOC135959839 [Calliphora vicina]|uniref:uncharacterized protein LOC135959839 n=1 Tax=Calliphora vicina TaxID=7373 RepID=UPI00325B0A83